MLEYGSSVLTGKFGTDYKYQHFFSERSVEFQDTSVTFKEDNCVTRFGTIAARCEMKLILYLSLL